MENHWPDYYKDTGCKYFPSCLNCPLPECLYDNPDALADYRLQQRRERDLIVAAIIRNEGLTTREAAVRFQVTDRSIYRILRRSRDYERATARIA